MEFGSLFTGIGGIDLGLERAGMTCAWQVEIDDYATKVLERRFPDVARFRDVRDCGAGNLRRVDLIAGGFPCQDVSLAGQRAGLAGARSGLWGEFARIIGEVKPRWVLVENVPGLLSVDDGGGFGTVLADLAALGFDAWWDCIPAIAVGAPHRRDRVWVVAHAAGQRRAPLEVQGAKRIPSTLETSNPWRGGRYTYGRNGSIWYVPNRDFLRVGDGLPPQLDRYHALGNAVVPQVVEWLGLQIVAADSPAP